MTALCQYFVAISRPLFGSLVWSHVLLINGLHKLSDNEWNTLYPLYLLLSSDQFSFQAPRILSMWCQTAHARAICLCSSLMYSSCKLIYLVCDQQASSTALKSRQPYSKCLWSFFSVEYSSFSSFPSPSISMFGSCCRL